MGLTTNAELGRYAVSTEQITAIKREIGRRVRAQRAYMDLTQTEVAEIAGTTPQMISRLERNGELSLWSLFLICRVLGVPVSSILEDIEPYQLEQAVAGGVAAEAEANVPRADREVWDEKPQPD